MSRWIFVIVLCMTLMGASADGAMAEEDPGRFDRFTIHNAVLAGTGPLEHPPVTILLDRTTGQTWMLAAIENKVLWIAVGYNPKVPDNALPPPATK